MPSSQPQHPQPRTVAGAAKDALEGALREASELSHDYVGTEHILLSLLNEDHGLACVVFTAVGGDLAGAQARARVLELLVR